MKITLLTGKTFELEKAFDFPLKVNTSVKLKRLNLRIDHKKRIVVLSMPFWCGKKKAFEFINAHLDWIEEKLAALPEVKEFEDGEQISLFGQMVTIRHDPDFGAPKLKGDVLFVGGDMVFLHRRVKDFIKREAKKEFLKRSKALADQIGCTLTGVTIKDTKSRWGSCSSLNHINYNWRIALAPYEVIDYLMAHEVAHLKHQDHSEAFWQALGALDKNFESGKSWLSKHGGELYLYR
ncbi:MAG: M48 family metallopeptidase [Alphaproteobacteria bacterium]|nr:M48 family metallopeptidase [Alphaproteobacteria bacterium]